jgi:hypothetical protein
MTEVDRARDLLKGAFQLRGSWPEVAKLVPGTTDEGLRKIAEGLTKRPRSETLSAIEVALGGGIAPTGGAREAQAILALMREAVVRQERLVAMLSASGVAPDEYYVDPQMLEDAAEDVRRHAAQTSTAAPPKRRKTSGGK